MWNGFFSCFDFGFYIISIDVIFCSVFSYGIDVCVDVIYLW